MLKAAKKPETRVIGSDAWGGPLLYTCSRYYAPAAGRPDKVAWEWAVAFERALQDWASKGSPCAKFTLVIDTHLWPANMDYTPYLDLARAWENYFCERVRRVVILVKIHPFARLIWRAISLLIAENTREKILWIDPDSLHEVLPLCDAPRQTLLPKLLAVNRDFGDQDLAFALTD